MILGATTGRGVGAGRGGVGIGGRGGVVGGRGGSMGFLHSYEVM